MTHFRKRRKEGIAHVEHVREGGLTMKKGLPIRNITTDPLGGELREYAEKFLNTIATDARFVGDDVVIP